MKLLVLALALLLPLAHAQNLIPVTGSLETVSDVAAPATTQTAPPSVPTNLRAALGITHGKGSQLSITLTLNNIGTTNAALIASRDSRQDCAFAPLLRILKVGSREVIYPTSGSPKLCTQDALATTLPAGKTANFEHKLALNAGEYMVEGWFRGNVNGAAQKIDAVPVKLIIK